MRLGALVTKRNRLRESGVKMGKRNRCKSVRVRVMSNVEKKWWGKQAMTPNLWRNK